MAVRQEECPKWGEKWEIMGHVLWRVRLPTLRSDFNKFRGNLKIFCLNTEIELAASVRFWGICALSRWFARWGGHEKLRAHHCCQKKKNNKVATRESFLWWVLTFLERALPMMGPFTFSFLCCNYWKNKNKKKTITSFNIALKHSGWLKSVKNKPKVVAVKWRQTVPLSVHYCSWVFG